MKTFVIIVLFVVGSIGFYSCKKVDTTYRDYTNNLNVFNGNAVQYLQSQTNQYDSFLLAVNRIPGLTDTLSGKAITLFALSNKSFSLALTNINKARADSFPKMPPVSLSTINRDALDSFLCRYIVRGKYVSTDLLTSSDGLLLSTVKYNYGMFGRFVSTNASGFLGGGPRQIKFSDTKHSIFERYWISVNTITTDIESSNAIINILPPGHDFGFGDDFIRAVNYR